MGTDFFDDDLAPGDDSVSDKPKAKPPEPVAEPPAPAAPSRLVDARSTRLVRQRQDMTNQAAGAATELERLRMRQEQLEKEKRALEDLTRKQTDYERGKQEMIEKLEKGILLAEKEEQQATQMAELLVSTRERFKEKLAELRAIHEESWSEQDFAVDLNKGLVRVEDAQRVYRQSLAKLNAAHWEEGGQRQGQPSPFTETVVEAPAPHGFSYWLKVGLAVSLPLLAVHVLIFIVWLAFAARG